uniref:Large ribosomal subunit protein bL28c n=2 Tax=Gracilariopsis TaxID=2781 RepID=A0A1C9CEU9_9FLOR|nr:ribosomal protein L28 [Gracilariopsis lemaneiformis]YP_009294660.1 ribosomal protein L28 [Gracilariopsis chorda]AJO68494.1 ribosomal protein L28 [Gracilariopsis lemaneiformis]AML79891.1 ribosomal protein L28 [Gracilariopsis lemaneiformis]AOM66920.1 ribosomal protein L28 [Gracilariopsis chorda]UAD88818.1 ribosomal protein L28 [Gracilariopsis chorda]
MVNKCMLTHKLANNAYSVSHSHVRTKKIQHINLQTKKIWSTKQKRWIKIKISTKAIKSLHKFKI